MTTNQIDPQFERLIQQLLFSVKNGGAWPDTTKFTEDFLKEWSKVNLIPVRKKNSRRPIDPHFLIWLKRVRQRCETTFSQITALFPKTIHAVTPKGFESKVMLFVIAFAIQCL